MRFEFDQGIPRGAIDWLWENVGQGNRPMSRFNVIMKEDKPEYAWFYERVTIEIPSTRPNQDSNTKHIPTITVKDKEKALIFALRWS